MAFLASTLRLIPLWTLAVIAAAQTAVELEAFLPRKQPDLTPEIDGQTVSVRGPVTAARADLADYSMLPIQNQRGTGLVLEGSRELQ